MTDAPPIIPDEMAKRDGIKDIIQEAMSEGALYFDHPTDQPERWQRTRERFADAILTVVRPDEMAAEVGRLTESLFRIRALSLLRNGSLVEAHMEMINREAQATLFPPAQALSSEGPGM